MSDGMQGAVFDFDLSDEEPTTEHAFPESPRAWALGTQPIPITEDTLHVRHLGQQTWHRVVAGSPSTLGYETACGLLLEFGVAEWRQQAHRGEPCTDGCFTAREVARFVPEVASTWRFHSDPKKK